MTRTFGFEIEFSDYKVKYNEIHNACKKAIEKFGSHPLSSREGLDKWTLKSEHCGHELTSPALPIRQSSFVQVKRIFNAINQECGHKTLVDRECGFHVHIQGNDLERKHYKNLLKWFWKIEPAIYQILPESRQDNEYVPSVRNEWSLQKIDKLRIPLHPPENMTSEQYDKYWDYREEYNYPDPEDLSNGEGLDVFRHYDTYKTIESRYAAATSNPERIINWIQLMIYLFEIGINYQIPRSNNYDYLKLCNLIKSKKIGYKFIQNRNKQLADWIIQRHDVLSES